MITTIIGSIVAIVLSTIILYLYVIKGRDRYGLLWLPILVMAVYRIYFVSPLTLYITFYVLQYIYTVCIYHKMLNEEFMETPPRELREYRYISYLIFTFVNTIPFLAPLLASNMKKKYLLV